MARKSAAKKSVFEQIKAGLEDSIAYSKGELSLATTELPSPPPKVSGEDIFDLRKKLHMSQAVFAAVLSVSTKTVQSWEQGLRQPTGSALRLIQFITKKPETVCQAFEVKSVCRKNRRGRAGASRSAIRDY